MTKIIPAALQTHLNGEVITVATIWVLTRTDGQQFRFTDHDIDIESGGFVYKASMGYDRTAISNLSGFNVDNIDIFGILDDDEIREDDLRSGRYDFAEVSISLVNYKDPLQGEARLRSGTLGEILYSEETGSFKTELRGLMARMNQIILPAYGFECRVDLGSTECGIPIWPNVDKRLTAYSVSNARLLPDYVRASNAVPSSGIVFLLDFDGVDLADQLLDKGNVGFAPTLDNGAEFTGGLFGKGKLYNPTTRFSEDDYLFYDVTPTHFGVNEKFTIECNFQFVEFDGHYAAFGSSPSWGPLMSSTGGPGNSKFNWMLRVHEFIVNFEIYQSPFTSSNPVFSISATVPGGADMGLIKHHVAITRDDVDNYTIWLDGKKGDTVNNSAVIENDAAADFRIGGSNISSHNHNFVLGVGNNAAQDEINCVLDELRISHGVEVYTADFTPPTLPHPHFSDWDSVDLGNVYYECTVSGVTGTLRPTFDDTPGNTTVDGTVTWTAREAWTRHGVVSGVTDHAIFQGTIDESRFVDGWFDFGAVIFETGDNIGLGGEVKGSTDVTTGEVSIQLFKGMFFPIQVGDQFRIYAGCDKTLATCRDKFDNVINFRGEPFMPGNDAVFRRPTAKGA